MEELQPVQEQLALDLVAERKLCLFGADYSAGGSIAFTEQVSEVAEGLLEKGYVSIRA